LHDCEIVATPHRHAKDLSLFWPRKGALGGGSPMNELIYARGHASGDVGRYEPPSIMIVREQPILLANQTRN
jgi:hypothetical protein